LHIFLSILGCIGLYKAQKAAKAAFCR